MNQSKKSYKGGIVQQNDSNKGSCKNTNEMLLERITNGLIACQALYTRKKDILKTEKWGSLFGTTHLLSRGTRPLVTSMVR